MVRLTPVPNLNTNDLAIATVCVLSMRARIQSKVRQMVYGAATAYPFAVLDKQYCREQVFPHRWVVMLGVQAL
jgi:hypothetical protein